MFFLFKSPVPVILALRISKSIITMSKKKRNRRLKKLINRAKLPFAAVSGILIVLVALITVTILVLQSANDDSTGLTAEQKSELAKKKGDERARAVSGYALEAYEKGDTSNANEVFKEAIESEKDIEQKIRLYLDQSALLYSKGKTKEAIAVAKRAEPLSEDKFLVADWLARLYEDQKEYKLAEKYYRLAAEWAHSDTNRAAMSKEYYERRAVQVAALGQKK